MPQYNFLVGCDQNYYDLWAKPLLESIKFFNPKVALHCHIVNPTKDNFLSNVDITLEKKFFTSEESKIAYLQAVRFLVVSEKFNKKEKVITLDADSICLKSIDQNSLESLFQKQYVLSHPKNGRWLAGFVTFNENNMRYDYHSLLMSKDIQEWSYGRDQEVLDKLSKNYQFFPLDRKWMNIGKVRSDGIFLTLKGNQKESLKYLKNYNDSLNYENSSN